MIRRIITAAAFMAAAACAGKGDKQQLAQDSLSRDLQLAPADSTAAVNDQPAAQPAPAPAPAPKPKPAAPTPAPAPSAPAPRTMTVATGASITATANDTLHSRHNKVGDLFHATVAEDVKDSRGRVAIPAGSVVTFKVALIEPAKSKSDPDGKLRLDATEVSIDGKTYPISGGARAGTVEHVLEGQGVTAGGAARVGAGAAGGAIAGKVIGGKTGAIVGGIAGAAGGAVLASKTADRDVVVRQGMKVTFTLAQDFTVTR